MTPRVRVCMYCSVVMGTAPEYCLLHEPEYATHGACRRCYRRFLRELVAGVPSPLLDLIAVRRRHMAHERRWASASRATL